MAVCPSCGTDNPDVARFCMVCATPLDQAPQPEAEERKVVSVLFVDLVGFTARSHDADPEDVRATLAPYHRLLKREIERFGGTVEKFIGDAVMAVFGAPVAHEDDAERAVRAALRITEAIEELNEATPNLDLSIRAAVNTGEGLVTLGARPQAGEGMVTGDVVNTASRLQGIAPVGGVAVGEITYRSTKDLIVYEEMEPVSVKGKPEPVAIWRADSARGRFGVDLETRHRTPFIGRDFDLGLLRMTYQRVLRESSIQLVTVVGEPGVGKSRLISEFWRFIDEQQELVTWRQGRSLPYGEGITFWALGEIIKAQAGISESDSTDVARVKLSTVVGSVMADTSDSAWIEARLAPLVGLSTTGGTAEQEESFTAWRRFFEAIADSGPLVLVFEDLHWADSALLEFIEHFVEWSTGLPITVVCTARPELFERHEAWAGGTRNAATISLSPLDDAEIAQMISGLLSQAVLPAEIHAALLERAGGNPLYAEEFIRMLFDRGLLRQRGRTMTLDPDADIPMPDNVYALIAARLDTLAAERKVLLHNAAVVGKVFWSGAVATLSDHDDITTRRWLQDFVRKELVRPSRVSSMEGQQEYSFWHTLVRDVAYGEIPRQLRAVKHREVGRWLEAMAGQRVADHAEVLAHHYQTAVALFESTGQTRESQALKDRTVDLLLIAGERAFDLDLRKAEPYFRKALALLAERDPRRAEALSELGRITQHKGSLDEAIQSYSDALESYRASGNVLGQGRVLVRLASAYWNAGRTTEGLRLTPQAIELLEPLDATRELAGAYNLAAEDAHFSGHSSDSQHYADQALAVAQEVHDQREIIAAMSMRGAARCDRGDGRGRDDLQEAIRMGRRSGLALETAAAYTHLVDWLWLMDGPGAALETARNGIEFVAQRGLNHMLGYLEASRVWLLYDLGTWEKVLATAEEVHGGAQRFSAALVKLIATTYKAEVLACRGRLEEAHRLCDELVPEARRQQDMQTLVPALAVAAFVAEPQSGSEAAVVLIEELEEVTRHSASWRSRHLPSALRVLIAAGKVEQAERFARGIKVTATRDVNCVLTGQAIMAEARSESEQARSLHEEAAQRWADYGFVLEEGQAHLGLARCLIALGDRYAATDPLHKARAIFERLGAVPLINETDSYLQAEAAS